MKIKCPYCKKEFDFKNWEALTDHWESSHGMDYEPCMGDYAELIFKIHEKIEYWEKEESKASYSMYALEIEILKSLLENK